MSGNKGTNTLVLHIRVSPLGLAVDISVCTEL